MALSDLYESGIRKNNLIHFAAMASIAAVDGEINAQEEALLKKFAIKLDIDEAHYNEVMSNPTKYPMSTVHKKDDRLEYLYDLFKMIYADHEIDEPESKLIYKYALGMGCSEQTAKDVIAKSIKLFSGRFDFEHYQYFVNK